MLILEDFAGDFPAGFLLALFHTKMWEKFGDRIRPVEIKLEEEGRGTRNGYEASKSAKGISGL